MDGTAAGTLDAAYNGGSTLAVDTAPVTLNDTIVDAGALLITSSGVITGSSDVNVLYVNSTGAHDTSGRVSLLNLNMGTEGAGTPEGARITMGAETDDALKIVKGEITVDDGGLTMSSVGNSTTSGWTVTTANTSGDGFTFNIDSLATGDGFIIDGDATAGALNYFAVQEGSVNIFTITDDDVYSTKPVEIDVDDADAFLVTESDNTEILSVDTTSDAGDTTLDVTSPTTTGVGIKLTSSITTGNALEITAASATSGNALYISVAANTMGPTGAAISVYDTDNTREVFAVRDDGSVYMYGTAEGTAVTQAITGDVVITDGDLTLSGGEVSVTGGTTTTGSDILLTSIMTTAGAATGEAGALTIIANSATTGTVLSVIANAVTSGDMLYLDNGGGTLSGGFYINCNDDNLSDFTVGNYGATVITGNASGVDALTLTAGDILVTSGHIDMTVGDLTLADGSLTITDADSAATLTVTNNTITTSTSMVAIASSSLSTGALMTLTASSVNHDGEILELINAGDAASTGTGMSITMPDITTGAAKGIDVVMAGSTTTAKGISVTMAAVSTGDMLYLDQSASDTMTASTGFYINCNRNNTSDFTVSKYGATVIAGTAEGTAALTLTKGDAVVTDGDLTVSAGEVAFTSNSTTAGLVIVNNTFTTGNSLVDVSSTSITTGALMRLNANTTEHDGEILELINAGDTTSTGTGLSVTMPDITTGAAKGIAVVMAGSTTTAKGISVTMAAVSTGDMLFLDQSAGDTMTAGSGFYINCNRNNVSDFSVSKYGATAIAGTAAGTTALTVSLGDFVITDTDATTITSVNGTGDVVTIANTSGVTGAGNAMLVVTSTGTIADGAFYVDITSGAAGASSTDSYLLHVDAAHAQIEGIHVAAGTCKFAEAIYTASAGAGVPAITVTPSADMGETRATEGALVIVNTASPGCGLNVYSDEDSAASGSLVMLTANNAGFDTYVLDIDNNGTADAVYIDNAGASNAIEVNQDGASGNDPATDGAIHVENTGNTGVGLGVYSNIAGTAAGVLVGIEVDNVAFDQHALSVQNDGTAAAVFVDSNYNGLALDIDQDVATHTGNLDWDTISVKRTNAATSTSTNTGAMLKLENEMTVADTAADTTKLIELIQDADSTGVPLHITNNGDCNAVTIDQDGDPGDTGATQAALLVENTGNAGVGFSVYSNIANSTGTLVDFNAANAGFDTAVLNVTNAGTANSVDTMTITNAGTSNALRIDQNGAVGNAVATDGALHIENTGNTGIGLGVYTALAATAAAELVSIKVNNAAFDQSVLVVNSVTDGAMSPVKFTSTSTLDADKAVLEVINDAIGDADSAVLRLEQTHASGVSCLLRMKQDDGDKPFMDFEGTSAADATASISSHGTPGATTDFIQILLNGVKAWIAVSTNDPSA